MGKVIVIILLICSGYGAYQHFNKFSGEKIPEHKLTSGQKEERKKNTKLAVLDSSATDSKSSNDAKLKIPPQISEFVNNKLEEWPNLTPGEKNELKHLSSRIDQRLPFGNYEKTLIKKLEDRNILEAIRQNNSSLIKNTDNVIHETNTYDTNLQQPQDSDEYNQREEIITEPDIVEPQMPEETVQEDLSVQVDETNNQEVYDDEQPLDQPSPDPEPIDPNNYEQPQELEQPVEDYSEQVE